MKTVIACLAMLFTICGYTTAQTIMLEQNTTVMLTAEAGAFMSILKEKGGIPEIPTARRGNLQSNMMCDPKQHPEFPFDAHFQAVMNDTPDTTYYFIVTKDNPTAPWTMSKAWKESAGKKIDLTLPAADLQNVANKELLQRKK